MLGPRRLCCCRMERTGAPLYQLSLHSVARALSMPLYVRSFAGTGQIVSAAALDAGLTLAKRFGPSMAIVADPKGERLSSSIGRQAALWLASGRNLVLVNPRLSGYDERLAAIGGLRPVSLGSFTLSSGDHLCRALLDLADRELSMLEGSRSKGQRADPGHVWDLHGGANYGEPRSYRGLNVPAYLVAGHHALITRQRFKESLR